MEEQTQKSSLKDWLKTVEWYDNHSLNLFLDCRRFYYYNKLIPNSEGGLGVRYEVSAQARIGLCHHAALATFYNLHNQPYEKRIVEAMRSFSREHKKNFSEEREEKLKTAYTEQRGHEVLEAYIENWKWDDAMFRPIESELTLIIPVAYTSGDPFEFEPFYIIQRLDGLWERVSNGDWFVLETKTTGKDVKGWLKKLSMDRQGTGYVWGVSQFEGGGRVKGILPNIILTAVEKFDFARDYVPKNPTQLENWRQQTIRIVRDIRQTKKEWFERGDWNIWLQSNNRCTDYGGCAFFDLCYFNPILAETMPANVWTPLDV